MANMNSGKLDSILSEDEIQALPDIVKAKLESHIKLQDGIIDELRTEKDHLQASSERLQFQLEKEVLDSHQELQNANKAYEDVKAKLADLEEKYSESQKTLESVQASYKSALVEVENVKKCNDGLAQEKRELVELLQKKDANVENLKSEIKVLNEQLAASNESKLQALVKSEEVEIQQVNLQHKEKRLEQEKDLLNKQVASLGEELALKTQEVLSLRREKASRMLELQAELLQKTDELHLAENQINDLKKNIESKDKLIESLAKKAKEAHESSLQSEEQFQQELAAQSKLVELYRNSNESSEKRVQELLRAVEEMHQLLQEAKKSHEDLEQQLNEVQQRCEERLKEKDEQLKQLQEELDNANKLLASSKGLTEEGIEKLFPTAAATSKMLRSEMTLTQMYSEYVRAQDELQKEKLLNQRLSQQLENIINEIEENTPLFNQRQQEYHKSMETISSLRVQLTSALTEQEQWQSEREELRRHATQLQKENHRLLQENVDLSKQVRVLIKEVEEARGGYVVMSRQDVEDSQEQEVTSSEDSSASKVISKHLVSFKNIEELQAKNQQLLAVVRELSERQEEQEKQAAEVKTMELKKELDQALSQLEELQQERSRQAEMVDAIVRQRDMYRVLLSQYQNTSPLASHGPLATSTPGSFLKQAVSLNDERDNEARSALKQLQQEFDNYRKEKAENTNMLNEQLENLRTEISDLRIQNAKLNSQLEYSHERFTLLQANLESYKKEAAALREKNQKFVANITEHQQTINTLRQDLMATQEKLAKSEVSVENLKAERELLKGIEIRLVHEKEALLREKQSQNRLLANLQTVQNNLERMDSEAKMALQNQVEKLEKECALLRSKLEAEEQKYRSTVQAWEKKVHDLENKIEREQERSSKAHDDLVDAYAQLHESQQQLTAAKSKLSSVGAAKMGTTGSVSGSPAKSDASSVEVKMLKEQVQEAQNESKALRSQLTLVQKSNEHHRAVAADLEEQLKNQNEAMKQFKESMEQSLAAVKEERSKLEKDLDELEKKHQDLADENLRLKEDLALKTQELRLSSTKVQKELEEAQIKAEEAIKREKQAYEDCQQQVSQYREAQDKYERELMLHAADVEAMTAMKQEFRNMQDRIHGAEEAAKNAEMALESSRSSWEEQMRIVKSELEAAKTKCQDLEAQNDALHQQLELMSSQMAAVSSKSEAELPPAVDDANKNENQLLEVIRYLRREKEIAVAECSAAQMESQRLRTKAEYLEKQVQDFQKELNEERERSQAAMSTTSQHAELLRKVEMLNVITESNRLLRDEKDTALQRCQELEAKLSLLENQIAPLQEKNRDLASQIDVLTAENAALQEEVKRWQARTNHLLEQSHKMGPEDYRRMSEENEQLQKQVSTLTDESNRHRSEVTHLTGVVASLQKELLTAKTVAETKDLELNKCLKELDLAKKTNSENQKTIIQVKKIARKYKTQYDELSVKYEEEQKLKESAANETTAEEKAQQEQWRQEAEEKIKEMEEKAKLTTEENEKMKEAMVQLTKDKESAESQLAEKDEKSRKLMAQVKQKIAQLTNQREMLTKENDTLRKETEEWKEKVSSLEQAKEEDTLRATTVKSQYEGRMARQEKELKEAKETIERLERQIEELNQRLLQQQKQLSQQQGSRPSSASTSTERASGSSEPLTANIRPLTPPPQPVASSSLRPHPHASPLASRPTPTASIRPMAIGSTSPVPTPAFAAATITTSQTQSRMATVLPTTASTPPTTDAAESSPSPSIAVHSSGSVLQKAVPPTPVCQSVTVGVVPPAPVVSSEQSSTVVIAPSSYIAPATPSSQENQDSSEVGDSTMIETPIVPVNAAVVPPVPCTPATALVTPRVGGSVVAEEAAESSELLEAPSSTVTTTTIVSTPTSSVISTGAANTQVVAPTVKRFREEADTQSDIHGDGHGPSCPPKRVRMVSDATQTMQQSLVVTSSVSPSVDMLGAAPSSSTAPIVVVAQPAYIQPDQEAGSKRDEAEGGAASKEEPEVVEVETSVWEGSAAGTSDKLQQQHPAEGEELVEKAKGFDEEQVQGEVSSASAEDEVTGGGEAPQPQERPPAEGEPESSNLEAEKQRPISSAQEEEIIVLESDDEDNQRTTGEECEAEREVSDYEPAEGDEGMDDEDGGYVDEENMQDVDEEDDDGEEEDMADDTFDDDGEEMAEQPADDDVEIIVDEGDDNAMDAQDDSSSAPPRMTSRVDPVSSQGGGGREATMPSSTSGSETENIARSSPSVVQVQPRHPLLPRVPGRERLSLSSGRQGLLPFTIQGQAPSYEEGDDSIVPSTPTLFVPRRADGFAEAVSSPRVPQGRFIFSGNSSEPHSSQAGLSQLASEGALGVDDTRMDLSQFDEGSGRSVPSTPLQVSPPETSTGETSEAACVEPRASSPSTTLPIITAVRSEAPHTSSYPTIHITCTEGGGGGDTAEEEEEDEEEDEAEEVHLVIQAGEEGDQLLLEGTEGNIPFTTVEEVGAGEEDKKTREGAAEASKVSEEKQPETSGSATTEAVSAYEKESVQVVDDQSSSSTAAASTMTMHSEHKVSQDVVSSESQPSVKKEITVVAATPVSQAALGPSSTQSSAPQRRPIVWEEPQPSSSSSTSGNLQLSAPAAQEMGSSMPHVIPERPQPTGRRIRLKGSSKFSSRGGTNMGPSWRGKGRGGRGGKYF